MKDLVSCFGIWRGFSLVRSPAHGALYPNAPPDWALARFAFEAVFLVGGLRPPREERN